MSMKPRVINGLNFIYDSGPQGCYLDGGKISRWRLVVDENFLEKFLGKMVPFSALADADALEIRLPENYVYEPISWEQDAACRVKRIFSNTSIALLSNLGAAQFTQLEIVRGKALSLSGLRLEIYQHLERASIIGLTDSKLLRGCQQLNELLLWTTDLQKLESGWLDGCNNLHSLELIECTGFAEIRKEVFPSVTSLQVVKPAKTFTLSALLIAFPSLRSLTLQGVRPAQVDCEPPPSVELFMVNEQTVRIDAATELNVEAEMDRYFGNGTLSKKAT